MVEKIQAVRGMNDILPEKSEYWQYIERVFADCLSQYAYKEIRFPMLESTQLFKRTIGEVTDIVEKEMYTFNDLNGDSLTLRPEGTAGCVRACLEHGLLYNQQQKLWYHGPMFRHEKPQKGRYRQFYQFGVEALGFEGTAIELELIAICYRFWKQLGLREEIRLEVNSLGSIEERHVYRDKLVGYFKLHYDRLDEDSKNRLERNPLRILDSKNPDLKALIDKAPRLLESLSSESRAHFEAFCQGLERLGIPYQYNPVLVRGLDYYGHTVFEWVTDKLGSQATVCAGGRYDNLIEHLGGSANAAVGFAMGEERLLLLLETLDKLPKVSDKLSVFMISDSDAALQKQMSLSEELRDYFPGMEVICNTVLSSFKSQFKKADKSNARFALIMGAKELDNHEVAIKDLRGEAEQISLSLDELTAYLAKYSTH